MTFELVNPFDILTNPKMWVEFEYQNSRGCRSDLWDYANRRKLYADLVNRSTSRVELNAWKYLLELENDSEVL